MIETLLQAERLLVHGMLDQAEDLYRRTAAQDPRNAIAVVGLARVALERGDDALAYARAREALLIDPENGAAIRLEARLAEVLATRGEPSGASPPASPEAAAESPPASPEARPSEQSVFVRNPSMAEHRRRTEEGGRPAAIAQPSRRQSLIRRLLQRG
jgi:tetratricopeptide (TPR) repeat protein